MKRKLFCMLLFSIILFESCETKKTTFDENIKKELFDKLNTKGKTSFSYKNLSDLLSFTTIDEVKKGLEIEQTFVFEGFDCNCKDTMKFYYDKDKQMNLIYVYEETYDADEDWCPETTYFYSFKIVDDKIVDVKKEMVAG